MGYGLFQFPLMHFRQIITNKPQTKPTPGVRDGQIWGRTAKNLYKGFKNSW